jgi:hypothetical protein
LEFLMILVMGQERKKRSNRPPKEN